VSDVAPMELGNKSHRNYKHAAPLALKPLKTQVVNYAQASPIWSQFRIETVLVNL